MGYVGRVHRMFHVLWWWNEHKSKKLSASKYKLFDFGRTVCSNDFMQQPCEHAFTQNFDLWYNLCSLNFHQNV